MLPIAAVSVSSKTRHAGSMRASASARSMTATSCGLPMDFAEIFTLSVNERPALACRGDQRDRLLHHPGVDRENGAEPFGDVQKGARREQAAVVGAQPEEQLGTD